MVEHFLPRLESPGNRPACQRRCFTNSIARHWGEPLTGMAPILALPDGLPNVRAETGETETKGLESRTLSLCLRVPCFRLSPGRLREIVPESLLPTFPARRNANTLFTYEIRLEHLWPKVCQCDLFYTTAPRGMNARAGDLPRGYA